MFLLFRFTVTQTINGYDFSQMVSLWRVCQIGFVKTACKTNWCVFGGRSEEVCAFAYASRTLVMITCLVDLFPAIGAILLVTLQNSDTKYLELSMKILPMFCLLLNTTTFVLYLTFLFNIPTETVPEPLLGFYMGILAFILSGFGTIGLYFVQNLANLLNEIF